jgi:hypothetical protein
MLLTLYVDIKTNLSEFVELPARHGAIAFAQFFAEGTAWQPVPSLASNEQEFAYITRPCRTSTSPVCTHSARGEMG